MSMHSVEMNSLTPIFRIFDENKAKEFYIDYLGFKLEWEHRFGKDMPLYMEVSFGKCKIHLSEHHGDCSPGGAIRIQTRNVKEYHEKLKAKKYKYLNPGLETPPWGSLELSVIDPFGNRIMFYENKGEDD